MWRNMAVPPSPSNRPPFPAPAADVRLRHAGWCHRLDEHLHQLLLARRRLLLCRLRRVRLARRLLQQLRELRVARACVRVVRA